MDEKDLTFKDFLEGLNTLGKSEWITVYEINNLEKENIGFYSAIIPISSIKSVLSKASWDLQIGDHRPGLVFTYSEGKETATYERFFNGLEPLVVLRSFSGMKESYIEISEEFRFYFNLYENRRNNKFIFIDDNGDEEDVILITESKVMIKLWAIKKFLSVKNMALALYFGINRYSEKTTEELGLKEFQEEKSGENFIYSIGLQKLDISFNDSRKSNCFIMGKKIIFGLKDFKPCLFDNEDKKYIDFIIGIDDEGKEILFTCDEDELSNYFGKNPGAPHYLTPVIFKKEVLIKYYSQPSKYSVEDGILRCGYLWSLMMDNNNPDFIMVFLGDLGHLSFKEQQYWRTFNIVTKGKMSSVAFRRNYLAQFTDTEKSDLYFKQKFDSFQKAWKEQFGWLLFKPLKKDDLHYLKTLRIPLTEDQMEFDAQVLSLTKILIDSLNEEELEKAANIKIDGSINKLEKFLESKGLKFDEMLEFLRNLQLLRSSGVAHRKGKNYEKVKKYFLIDEKDLSKIFDDILIRSIWTINSLSSYFLLKKV